jgi:hypothetical protein
MVEILKTLKDTPLPSILVIGGIVFLLLSFVRKVGSNIELEPAKTWVVGIIGIILLCSGVGLYLIPAVQIPLAIAPTQTPVVEAATQAIEPTTFIQLSVIPSTEITQTTQSPIPTTSVQEIIYDCPNYLETGKGKSLSLSIDIPSGEIAFIDGYGFDNKKGGVFVTITGPYQGQHVITDGAFCSGIDINANYAPLQEQRLNRCASCQKISLP